MTNKGLEASKNMAEHGFNCAQAVLGAFCEDLGLKEELALSIAQGFGGGMARRGSVCGAVTGAYMALGLANPASVENPRRNLNETYSLVNEFAAMFEKLHGSVDCTKLIGFNLGDPEELAKARQSGVFTNKCPGFVKDAVEIVEKLIQK